MKFSKYWTTVTPFSITLTLILFIAFPIIGFWVGVNYQQSLNLIQNPSQVITTKPTITTPSYHFENNNTYFVSPNGSYKVATNFSADSIFISVLDKQDNVIVSDLIEANYNKIGYGTKFGCQCGTNFDKWVDDSHFLIKIGNGIGEEYQYLVNASTGQIDEKSFKKIK